MGLFAGQYKESKTSSKHADTEGLVTIDIPTDIKGQDAPTAHKYIKE